MKKGAHQQHPALRSKNAKIRQAEQDVDRIPGWAAFTLLQKLFLMVLPLFRQYKMACEFIGKDENWGESQRKHYPLFARACRIRLHQDARIIDSFATEMWLAAQARLVAIIGDADPKVAMMAIRLTSQLVGQTEGAHARTMIQPAPEITQITKLEMSYGDAKPVLSNVEGGPDNVIDLPVKEISDGTPCEMPENGALGDAAGKTPAKTEGGT